MVGFYIVLIVICYMQLPREIILKNIIFQNQLNNTFLALLIQLRYLKRINLLNTFIDC